MTEAEWLSCTDQAALLESLRASGKASERRMSLFAAACCRRAWPHMADERTRWAVEVAERFVDGLASAAELSAAEALASQAVDQAIAETTPRADGAVYGEDNPGIDAAYAGWTAALAPGGPDARFWSALRTGPARDADPALLRCIFGNPFRPITLDPGMMTPTLSLARAAYDERLLPSGELDPARLAILADALEDTGCTDTDLLDHLRGPGPHVRGCHVVDLILGLGDSPLK